MAEKILEKQVEEDILYLVIRKTHKQDNFLKTVEVFTFNGGDRGFRQKAAKVVIHAIDQTIYYC